jgi:hypothetical protein
MEGEEFPELDYEQEPICVLRRCGLCRFHLTEGDSINVSKCAPSDFRLKSNMPSQSKWLDDS